MNIFNDFQRRITAAVARLETQGRLPPGLDASKVVVEPSRDPAHGDLATNAALVLARQARMAPRALADLLANASRAESGVAGIEVAGPGFINITLAAATLQAVVGAIVADPHGYGRAVQPAGSKVNVEYVSANPTGPLHVGHARGAVFGDALASLLAFAGWDVVREYYINDAGSQIDTLARSAYLRYCQALGEEIGAIPDGLYPGDYLKPVGQALARDHGAALLAMAEADRLAITRERAVAMMMDLIRADLATLAIRHDVFFSERSLQVPDDRIAATLEDLRARGLVYEGRLPPPKGQPVEDWEDREQTLFRASAFGDDIDRPLLKSDGSYTYFANDIAYHASKFARGSRVLIDVLGADHGGYVKRMTAAVRAVTNGQGELDVKLCQLVRLTREGQPVKMSKRAGEFVTLREVVGEVGPDPVRFMMLFRKNDAALDFDLAKAIEQSKDNPVFYVQYAHARCRSVFRQAGAAFGETDIEAFWRAGADPALLTDEAELDLIRRLAQFPRIVEAAAGAHEPHRVAFYLHDLASDFHALWNRGKEAPHLRFVIETDRNLTSARLALVFAAMAVIASGLSILGVAAPDEMR